MQQRDYLERMIRDVATALARAFGLIDEKKLDDAEVAIAEGWKALTIRRGDLDRLDDATVRAMLGAKGPMAAKLLNAEAAVVEARGHGSQADELRARATRISPASDDVTR